MKKILRLLFVAFALISTHAYSLNASQACENQLCAAVVDAGSTGTRVHLYTYEHDQNGRISNIREIWSQEIQPGLASINPKPNSVANYLTLLFNQAPETNFPVYFYATAGMRLLPQLKQEIFYHEITQWFHQHPEWSLQDVRTITGKEEAVFGWLAVNLQVHHSNHRNPPIGVMDMGGASVQIAFPVEASLNIDPDDLATVTFEGQRIKLFVHSFLGLGQTVFAYQFLDVKSCYPNQYPLPSGLTGQGNAETCQTDITKLINLVHEVKEIVQPALRQNTPRQWYVLGGLTHLVNDTPFHFNQHEFSPYDLFVQGNIEICSKSWNDLMTEYSDHINLHNYCLFPSYYYALIVNGYGINQDQPIDTLPKATLSDWTVGVVLRLGQTL